MGESFEARQITVDGARLFVRWGGSGPPLVLLHGFPQTHLMWRHVAAQLSDRFTIVCPDLRGYGASSCPPSTLDHSPYGKRAMARDIVQLMEQLGFDRFAVAGHDRGGRVAYRLALDHPAKVTRLAVLDIVPTGDAWDRADAQFALDFWPWSLLAQPAPLPERLISGAPEAVIDDALSGWGTPASSFPADVRDAYLLPFRDPEHVHAICEEYRAAASLDRGQDRDDALAGRKIQCPILVLWSQSGPLQSWYAGEGGPLSIWRRWALDVRGTAVAGGHFFPEEVPDETAQALGSFFNP